MKKIFSLFAAMLVAFAVNAQTDFAGGYNCTADDAVLSNVYGLSLETTSNPHCILCNEATWNVVLAKWTVQASRGCYVTVSLDMGAAQGSNKHIFEVKISDSKGNAKGTLVEAKENAVADDVILLDGTILLPAAGEYTVELTSRRQYGKGRIKNVILTYDSDAPSEIIEVSAIELDKTELTLELQEVELLTATVSPDNATDPSVTWESDDEAIATVNENGLVNAIAEGTANIKAKAGEKEAICAVTVVANTIPNVDFAGPCVLSGKKARLEGKIWKNENYKLYGNGGSNKHYGNAYWTINITRPCVVSAVLNGVEGGHLFELDLFNAENDSITTILQPDGKTWSAGDIALEGSFNIATAGVYTFRLRNTQEWSSGKVEGITLTAPKPIYLKPGIWNQGNEKFAIWDITNEKWSEFMVLAENETDIYTAEVAADAEKVIFARINGEAAAPNWDAKWNQTENLDILEGKDMFEISCWNCSAYGNSDGSWSKYVAPEPVIPGKFYITGDAALVGSELAWNPAAIKVTEDSYTFENLAAGSYMLKVTEKGDWSIVKGFDALTTVEPGVTRGEGGDDDNICFTLAEAGNVTVTYTGEVFKVEGNFYVAPVEDPAKFYITGNASLVGADKAWHSDAIKVTEDTYIFENLPASYYQLKVSVDGTWSNTKGFSDLTGTVADGLSADGDNNICFKLDKAGDVTVTYTGEVFKVEGNFWVQRLHNGFYLVGTFNGVEKWDAASLTAGDEFEWNKNIGEGNEEWKITVALTAGDKFKAVYVYEDEITTWYPDGSDNEYLVNADHAGAEKTIFFQEKHNYEWGGHFYVESNGGSTAVDNAEATVTATKAIENGMLIIKKNGVRYSVTGQVIR